MKKILFLMVQLFVVTNIMAQVGWSQMVHEGDELQKTKTYLSYRYEDEVGNSFIYWSNSKDFRIISNDGLFDSDVHKTLKVQIGYYDEDGNLVKKEKKTLYILRGDYQKAETGVLSKGTKLLQYLETQAGYVRILAPKYESVSPWEIKVPCRTKGELAD